MKIYNKGSFLFGVAFLVLCVAQVVFMIQKGFDGIRFACCAGYLIAGVRLVLRSISREHAKEDQLNLHDERSQAIRAKARNRAVVIAEILMFCSAVFFFYLARVPSNGYDPAYIGFGFTGALFVTMLTELATTLYYEHHM